MWGIFHIIMSVPQNTLMDLNNVVPKLYRSPTPVHTSPGVVVSSGFSGALTLNFDVFLGVGTPPFWSFPSTGGSGGGLGVKHAIASREASNARVFASVACSAALIA